MSEHRCKHCNSRVLISTPAVGAGYVTVFRNPETHTVIDQCDGCGRHLYQALTMGDLVDAADDTPAAADEVA
jgi:hypothetical protein